MTQAVPIFPRSLQVGFSIEKNPTFSSIVATAVTGKETTSARQAFPLWAFTLTFEILRDSTQNTVPYSYYGGYTEFRDLLTTFMLTRGQATDFYFDDPSDDSRLGQAIGIGDSARLKFPIVRTWGSGALGFAEPVGGIDLDQAITIRLGGTPTGAYTIDATQQYILFTSPPGSSVVITADFNFFYRCRFTDDIEDLEQFFHNLWLVKTLKFRSVKLGIAL